MFHSPCTCLCPALYSSSMTKLFPDTNPKAEAVLIRLLRQAPTWRKLEMIDQLNQSVKLFALAGLRQRYRNNSEAQLHRRLAGLLLGDELARKVYGPLPEDS
jgi:hypothetical protein